jgi:geranylgeranyl diphosphate synthase type II
MVGGQSLDLIYENACAEESVVEEIHINKTAKLIIASIFAGARLSTNNSHIINKFKKFAFNIGLAFQIIDDILDITVSMEQLGKSKSDKKKNKTTYPSVFGLDRSKEIADNLTAQAKKEIDFLKEKGAVLNSLTDFIIERIN